MNLLFPLLYAPTVFFALSHYPIKIVALIVMSISLLWFLILKQGKKFEELELLEWQPLFYMFIGAFAYEVNAFMVLKMLPFLISLAFSFAMLLSYLKNKSIILYFAQKFSPSSLSTEEKLYIHHSTIFWFAVTLLNTLIHLSFLFESNLDFWLYYSSVGWYMLFALAGVAQFLHRHYIFLRRTSV